MEFISHPQMQRIKLTALPTTASRHNDDHDIDGGGGPYHRRNRRRQMKKNQTTETTAASAKSSDPSSPLSDKDSPNHFKHRHRNYNNMNVINNKNNRNSWQYSKRLSSCWTICIVTIFIIVTGVSLVVSSSSSNSLSSSNFNVDVSVNDDILLQADKSKRSPQKHNSKKTKRTIFSGFPSSNSGLNSKNTNLPLPSTATILLRQQQQPQPQQHQQNIGNYSRIYLEKHFHLPRNVTILMPIINHTIESETNVRFDQEQFIKEKEHGKKVTIFPYPPLITGVFNQTNKTVEAFPEEGKAPSINLTISTFKNVTLIGGRVNQYYPNGNGNGNGNNGDSIHPLTRLNNQNRNRNAYLPQRPGPCDQSSCYPATGNLLIGREPNLTATSTCGMFKEERYCIVSHLEDKKKCFRCDSSDRYLHDPGRSHRIQNILHRTIPGSGPAPARTWWQSENGVENVSIQLDLEAEFHFTHLIITFKTFRPAAMFIERSDDYGKTWKVYRYFAYDCASSFPNIPTGLPKSITDVICESRYSAVTPSTDGEIIFRVLPKNLNIQDPYSHEVQSLLRMTNIRINFTKLHTLGDDLLDKRQEIQEKYYYAIYEMVVRGSCSCYGHASRCLPTETSGVYFAGYGGQDPNVKDMVYGRCECTHNTKGANCEQCEDFYHDVKWQPAVGKQYNACKRCNCNNHATSCHFDERVYEDSGQVSGGVCDNCQHNTQGKNCEQCEDFYYLREGYQISDIDACAPCECDPRGSSDGGRCYAKSDAESNLVAGSCHCKSNVTGIRCDQCVKDYWNLNISHETGCIKCTCDPSGTVEHQGCNMFTGLCTCKPNVIGQNCDECSPEYWGLLDDGEGCKACDCDVGGAYNNNCDKIEGNCSCRNYITKRDCRAPVEGYFVPNLDHIIAEAELASDTVKCQVVVREPPHDGRDWTWSGVGFQRCGENAVLELSFDKIITSMDYDLVIRYEPPFPGAWQQVKVTVTPETPLSEEGICSNSIMADIPVTLFLRSEAREAMVQHPICLERDQKYKVRLDFENDRGGAVTPMLIDSVVLLPRGDNIPFFLGTAANEYRKREFDHYGCLEPYKHGSGSFKKYTQLREECKRILYSLGAYVFNGAYECQCNKAGSTSEICDPIGGQCPCKKNVVGRTCDRCAPGTWGFEGQDGCTACDCHPYGSLDSLCTDKTGQCECRENAYGQHCDQCQTGFWKFPTCQRCNCNGHAASCVDDPYDDYKCLECEDFTTGSHCDRCIEGYYGDPRLGVERPCKPCPCPGTHANHTFAKRCALERSTDDVICECQEGYAGPRCDICADNYFGEPELAGGNCTACNCNGNIDISRPGNCQEKTGDCLQCLHNTEGNSCEICKEGFFGNALEQSCARCVCNILGTNASAGACDRFTGQCHCLPNVIGISCDRCEEDHWRIALGEGCEPCACYQNGSLSTQCNSYDGQCACRSGFGGRQCNECEANYWGDPTLECYPCECNEKGSAKLQCDRTNGSCVCLPGIGGSKCDECARGYITLHRPIPGYAPSCSPCGECFENWDRVLGELSTQTRDVMDAASQIKQQGATGAYTREFEMMQTRIDEVKDLLKSSSISSSDLRDLEKQILDQRYAYGNTSEGLDAVTDVLANVSQKLLLTTVSLDVLEKKVDSLQVSANSLKDKAINLQEANVEGALNLTREAKRRSDDAIRRVDGVQRTLADSRRQRDRIQFLRAEIEPQLNNTQDELNDALDRLDDSLAAIDASFPELNKLVCGRGGENPCNEYCGGAGCGSCGGLSCNDGAVTTSENALKFAQNAYTELKRKDSDAEELYRAVTQTKEQVDDANALAKRAFNEADTAKNNSEAAKLTLEELENEIQEFLNASAATPREIRQLAEEVLSKNITLRPDQIDELAAGIRRSMTNLRNIDDILRATQNSLFTAENLKQRADEAAAKADKVLQEAVQVRDELDKTKEAQNNADNAIEKAKEDIAAADLDLKQIQSETADADKNSRESLTEVEALKDRLGASQRKYLENERMRTQVTSESEAAFKNATEVQKQAAKLNEEYASVSRSLDQKLKRFEGAKGKEELQNRANRLASNVNEKLTELNEMDREYSEHDRRTNNMLAEINRLTRQMELYFQDIKRIEEYHRNCNP